MDKFAAEIRAALDRGVPVSLFDVLEVFEDKPHLNQENAAWEVLAKARRFKDDPNGFTL